MSMMGNNTAPAWLYHPECNILLLLSQTARPAQSIGIYYIQRINSIPALAQTPHLLPTIVSLIQSLLSANITTPAGIVDAGIAVEVVVMCLDTLGITDMRVELATERREEETESLDLVDGEEDMAVNVGDIGGKEPSFQEVTIGVNEHTVAPIEEMLEQPIAPIHKEPIHKEIQAVSTEASATTSKSTTPTLTKKKTGKKFVNPVRLPSHNFTDIVMSSDDEDSEPDVQSKLAEKEKEIKRVLELIEQKEKAGRKKAVLKKKESDPVTAKSFPVMEIRDTRLSDLGTRSKEIQAEISNASATLTIVEKVPD
jgi:hypothetical protein